MSDALVVTVCVFAGMVAWTRATGAAMDAAHTAACVVVIALWMLGLSLEDTRSHRVTGAGASEFRRMWQATIVVVAIIAISAVFFPHSSTKGTIAVAMPLGFAALLLERAAWREWLKSQRRKGGWSTRVLLVGSGESVRTIHDELERAPAAGFRVVGVCKPPEDASALVSAVRSSMAAASADTVIVTGTDGLEPDRVKEISWSLEPGREHLMLAPNITDIAGPRIRTRPAAGLPLIHVETPRLGRTASLTKRGFDIAASAALIALLSPVLAVVALLVKLSSPGPVLYRQERIGHLGETFPMLKFRSMRQGADAELAALLEEQGTGTEPLFKVKNDPRITRVGRVLRKYSLDELPQLFNVLDGTMSLVGPRPQIAEEVALYSKPARRRLLTRPGITGLWQVSGRSALDWDQAVRLDLYYVENWSLISDIHILLRTVKAVVLPGDSAS
ncbi:sugar transferase [Demequina activiva]|uniref:Polyprenyl glycosylphosphotransferase n=1 Tax=Demequina activiva TaxID=1582364 RepID=A0A919Q3X4_9MICO|nr:sugar transferase [Demequina activiva]GIG53420.1 polyprenyl glycosylphosphotransferase [Demequina activiva]